MPRSSSCATIWIWMIWSGELGIRKSEVKRRVSACRPSYFLLLRQKKVTKEKASQRPCPCGVPCATRAARGRAQTRFAQTSARPDPHAAALLSTAYGPGVPNTACARSLRSPCTRRTRRDALRARAQRRPLALAPRNAVPPPYPHQAPSPNPLTTTASFPNRGQQTLTAASLTNTPIRPKKTKLGVQAPLHPPRG